MRGLTQEKAQRLVEWASEHADEHTLSEEVFVDGERVSLSLIYRALQLLGAEGLPHPSTPLTIDSPRLIKELSQNHLQNVLQ
jgi:hypothetical protein